MSRLNADDRIVLRVERLVPAENLDRHRIGLDPLAAAGEGFLHDIGQKLPVAFGAEGRIAQNPV